MSNLLKNLQEENQMEKQKITDRIQLLNDGRAHYLEYLRNLTPQIIIFTILILMTTKLDFTRFDLNNWASTSLFYFLLGSFILAVYANCTIFWGRCFDGLYEWRSELHLSLNTQGIKGFRRFFAILNAFRKEKSIETIEAMIIFFFFQVAPAIVIYMAITSATSIWLNTHHAG